MASRKADWAQAPQGFPGGRRSPKGKLRWYLAQVPKGREQSTCEKVRSIVGGDVLDDAFVPRKERWRKTDGEWGLCRVPMYEDYFVVATRDVAALDRELAKLGFAVRVVGGEQSAYLPLARSAQTWLEQAMDDDHVLRNSTGVIVDGQLHVQEGPLVGQEGRVKKVDRHHRRCIVSVGEEREGYMEQLPLEVPFKS